MLGVGTGRLVGTGASSCTGEAISSSSTQSDAADGMGEASAIMTEAVVSRKIILIEAIICHAARSSLSVRIIVLDLVQANVVTQGTVCDLYRDCGSKMAL